MVSTEKKGWNEQQCFELTDSYCNHRQCWNCTYTGLHTFSLSSAGHGTETNRLMLQ